MALTPRRTGRPRARPRPDRRAQLLLAAAAVVARNGYQNTSMKDIAAEAGVAQALLHYYFDSKEELLSEVVLAIDLDLLSEWKAAVAGVTDPLRRIVVGLDAAAASCSRRPEFWRLLFDLHAVSLNNPAVRERLRRLADGFRDEVAAEVANISRALPRPIPVDPGAMAEAVTGAVDGIALQALLRDGDATPAFEALKTLILGLAALSYLLAGEEAPPAALAALLGRSV